VIVMVLVPTLYGPGPTMVSPEAVGDVGSGTDEIAELAGVATAELGGEAWFAAQATNTTPDAMKATRSERHDMLEKGR
jgi:hypothetical protein